MCKTLQVAVVGASGSGKTWLARKIAAALAPDVVHLSLDSFYRDLSKLAPQERDRVNFDDPAAIDWECFRQVLDTLARRGTAQVPIYDFATHTRRSSWQAVPARGVIVWDGLWLLHEPWLRERFGMSVFVDCPPAERLARRIERDVLERGRRPESVRRQFEEQVEPMRKRFVEPQRGWATFCVSSPISEAGFAELLTSIRTAARGCEPESGVAGPPRSAQILVKDAKVDEDSLGAHVAEARQNDVAPTTCFCREPNGDRCGTAHGESGAAPELPGAGP